MGLILIISGFNSSWGKEDEFINYDPKLFADTKKLVNLEKEAISDCNRYEHYRLQNIIRLKYLNLYWPEENQQVKLRSIPKNINEDEYKAILYQYNFYDNFANEHGCFRNKFEQQVEFSAKYKDYKTAAYLDQVTGLMWKEYKKERMSFEDAKLTLDEWNNHNYGGYNDWRMPTLDEAASLYSNYAPVIRAIDFDFWSSDKNRDLNWAGDLSLSFSYLYGKERRSGNRMKPVKFKLFMVRNQPPPYPIKKEEVDPVDERCREWEFYHARPDIMKKPEGNEWPEKITAIHLRSKPLYYKGDIMVEKELKGVGFNFLDGGFKCFQNYYIDVNSDVVVDLATNLMWQKKSTLSIKRYKHLIKQEDYIKVLNKDKFNGFNDWRVPTTPEISSLIEETDQRKNRNYLVSFFYAGYVSFNVSDTFSYTDSDRLKLIMLTASDTSGFVLDRNRPPIRKNIKAVRSLSPEEVQKYCKQKGVVCQ